MGAKFRLLLLFIQVLLMTRGLKWMTGLVCVGFAASARLAAVLSSIGKLNMLVLGRDVLLHGADNQGGIAGILGPF